MIQQLSVIFFLHRFFGGLKFKFRVPFVVRTTKCIWYFCVCVSNLILTLNGRLFSFNMIKAGRVFHRLPPPLCASQHMCKGCFHQMCRRQLLCEQHRREKPVFVCVCVRCWYLAALPSSQHLPVQVPTGVPLADRKGSGGLWVVSLWLTLLLVHRVCVCMSVLVDEKLLKATNAGSAKKTNCNREDWLDFHMIHVQDMKQRV